MDPESANPLLGPMLEKTRGRCMDGTVAVTDFGAQFRRGPHSAPDAGVQAMRSDTGMPRWVMMLMTLQPMATSVLCFGRVRAWRRRPIRVL